MGGGLGARRTLARAGGHLLDCRREQRGVADILAAFRRTEPSPVSAPLAANASSAAYAISTGALRGACARRGSGATRLRRSPGEQIEISRLAGEARLPERGW